VPSRDWFCEVAEGCSFPLPAVRKLFDRRGAPFLTSAPKPHLKWLLLNTRLHHLDFMISAQRRPISTRFFDSPVLSVKERGSAPLNNEKVVLALILQPADAG